MGTLDAAILILNPVPEPFPTKSLDEFLPLAASALKHGTEMYSTPGSSSNKHRVSLSKLKSTIKNLQRKKRNHVGMPSGLKPNGKVFNLLKKDLLRKKFEFIVGPNRLTIFVDPTNQQTDLPPIESKNKKLNCFGRRWG